MKKLFTLGLLALSFQVHGSVAADSGSADSERNFSFQFAPFQGEVYTYEIKSNNQKVAYEKAAQACFDHFKAGRRVSMEFGQDIIDVCVNPRSKI